MIAWLRYKKGDAMVKSDAAPARIVRGLGDMEKRCHMYAHGATPSPRGMNSVSYHPASPQTTTLCGPLTWSGLCGISSTVCVLKGWKKVEVEVRLIGTCPTGVPWHASANHRTLQALYQIDTRIHHLASISRNTMPQMLLAVRIKSFSVICPSRMAFGDPQR